MQQAEARVGTTLRERWTIDRVLGAGGMATVYAATHRNGKRVAIKVLHPELSAIAEVRARFLREGYAANAVGHRGVVTVDDDDATEDGAAFLVMELLEGETLEQLREQRGGALPPVEVLGYAVELLDVLAAAHDKGIVHRDLKPENLFVTREGVLKVLDFGIARVREGAGSLPGTRVGAIMGTPAFMAPEQARARWELVDARTDLWAVGATLFTLLSGRYVRAAGTANEEIALAITTPAPSLASIAPHLPAGVVALVDRALAYDPTARWQDARSMQAAARALLIQLEDYPAEVDRTGPAIEASAKTAARPEAPSVGPTGTIAAGVLTTEPPLPRAHRPWIGAAVAAGAVGLLVVAGLVLGAGRGTPSSPTAAPELGSAPMERAALPSATQQTPPLPTVTAAPEPTVRPISVADLPDVAPSATVTTAAASAAQQLPRSPPAVVRPKTAADPFAKRK